MIVPVSGPQTVPWLTACITEASYFLRLFHLFEETNNLANWWAWREREEVTWTLGSWGAGDDEVKLLSEPEVWVRGQHVSVLSKEMAGNAGFVRLVLQRLEVPERQVVSLTATGGNVELIPHFPSPEILHSLNWINCPAQLSLCK